MTESTSNPSELHKLNDDELDEVAGGQGYWNPWNETRYRRNWVYARSDLTFEDWLKTRTGEDNIKARDAWLADNSPQNLTYYYDNGNTWTQPYEE